MHVQGFGKGLHTTLGSTETSSSETEWMHVFDPLLIHALQCSKNINIVHIFINQGMFICLYNAHPATYNVQMWEKLMCFCFLLSLIWYFQAHCTVIWIKSACENTDWKKGFKGKKKQNVNLVLATAAVLLSYIWLKELIGLLIKFVALIHAWSIWLLS